MRQTGTIIAIDEQSGYCTVRFSRESACNGCHAPCQGGAGCVTGLVSTPPIVIIVKNKLSKQVGEQTTVETKSSKVVLLTAILYLLPAILAIAAYCLCAKWFGVKIGIFSFFIVLVGLFFISVSVCTTLCRRMIHYEMVDDIL